eukprot:scaffold85167_cov47-Cyclotella_meneghiniana.AAC.1
MLIWRCQLRRAHRNGGRANLMDDDDLLQSVAAEDQSMHVSLLLVQWNCLEWMGDSRHPHQGDCSQQRVDWEWVRMARPYWTG